jgi:acetylornithine deacetylase/succinyl-diaminopimelate desuccinylase-like protein
MGIHRALNYAVKNSSRFVADLQSFIRFPTVSAQPEHAGHLKECAKWLADHLRWIGLKNVRVIPTRGHPIVYADWLKEYQRPTVLIYGHYDVQPAEPLDQWHVPPFEPAIQGEELYGRGASDDKGQMFAHVKALEAYLQTEQQLPVNVRCIFEGEEEIGSQNLSTFLRRNKNELTADIAILSDTRMLAPDRPALTYAMRGALSLELEIHGAAQDLHSGNFGGAIHNPLQVLCEIIASLHDCTGRVMIPGFYDRVRRCGPDERQLMARNGPTDAQILRDAQAAAGWGEHGYTLYERTTIRPALTINGITGGYQGTGGKAVIPAKAAAKLNFRLVPDQDPHEIDQLFRQHVRRLTPNTVRSQVRTSFTAQPALINRTHPGLRAAAIAYRAAFGKSPVFLRSGGTIPVVNTLQETLGIPTILMGFALPDDSMHAPNEKFHLRNFYRGISTSIHFLNEIAHTIDSKGQTLKKLREPANHLMNAVQRAGTL